MRIDEYNFEIIQRAYDITGIPDKIYWRDAENIDGYIDTSDVIDLLDGVIDKYNGKRDELQELIDYIDNKKEKYDPYYEYGVNERDFH